MWSVGAKWNYNVTISSALEHREDRECVMGDQIMAGNGSDGVSNNAGSGLWVILLSSSARRNNYLFHHLLLATKSLDVALWLQMATV